MRKKLKVIFESLKFPTTYDVDELVEKALKNAKYDKNKDYAYKEFCRKLDNLQ